MSLVRQPVSFLPLRWGYAVAGLVLTTLGPLAGPWMSPKLCHAQGKSAPLVEKVAQLNREAGTAFDGYSYGKGQRLLQEALQLGSRGAGDQQAALNKVLAETQVLLGVASVAGHGDSYRGLHSFVAALRLDRSAALPPRLATPQLAQVFESAKRAIETLGRPPRIQLEPERRRKAVVKVDTSARGLDHVPIDEARGGYAIAVRAATGVDIRAQRLVLHYRAAGRVKYEQLAMSKEGNVYRTAIPAAATAGRYLHYYIEAVDQRGRVAAGNGSARSPNVVTLTK